MSLELCIFNCKEGDTPIQHAPFLRSNDPDPRMQAFINSYNAQVERNIRMTAVLNSDNGQAQPRWQEDIRHVGAGSYNPLTKTWEDEGIEPQTNAEESYSGVGEYNPFTKKWV